jgi:cytochrome c-type biogenesis protein CcmH
MSRRLTSLAVAAVLFLVAAPSAMAVAPRTSLTDIEPTVMCAVCKIPLNVAESPQADRERAFIVTLINKGYTADQVRSALVAQYGPSVIAQPQSSGFGLVAYIVPIVVVVALAGLLAYLLPRWRRRSHAPIVAGAAPLGPADRARLDADLDRYEG